MTTALFVAGLVVMIVGLVLIVFAPRPTTEKKGAEARGLDPAEILKQVNDILAKLDQRYRIGAFVMMAGLALVSIAAYLEARDANQAAAAFRLF